MPVGEIESCVTLLKAPKYENKTWKHDSYRSAAKRAWALQDMHSCKITTNPEDRTIAINATDYYNS